ncbi:hypothetical protein P5673_012430 [Acropora cervicornis]|uniref:Uncharacterized protein n=1 Tax=Acropora cervicornis TaxID=6130 RepID=A0AAD9QMW8_ACRCE|nr:hypothetical protein P5673_012430 [Acropora cervicornis]
MFWKGYLYGKKVAYPNLDQRRSQRCCITNALDGTEDDDIWQEDDDCDPFNDEDGGDDLYYAEELDREAAEIDEDEYDRLFGESDNEEFDGF